MRQIPLRMAVETEVTMLWAAVRALEDRIAVLDTAAGAPGDDILGASAPAANDEVMAAMRDYAHATGRTVDDVMSSSARERIAQKHAARAARREADRMEEVNAP